VHGVFYVTDRSSWDQRFGFPTCCGDVFGEKPILTKSGACFTTQITIPESVASTYSSVRFWTNMPEEQNVVFDMNLLGSEGSEKHGVAWTISNVDHPSSVLFNEFHKVSLGTSTTVGLKKRIMDRTKLSEHCLDLKNESFYASYGIPASNFNCQIINTHYLVPNCSLGILLGLKEGEHSSQLFNLKRKAFS